MEQRYSHASKVGNHGDVLKHMLFVAILRDIQSIEEGLGYMVDTHSGNGAYTIYSNSKGFARGASGGVVKVLDYCASHSQKRLPQMVEDYLALLKKYNAQEPDKRSLSCYPGSPMLAQMIISRDCQHHCWEINEDHCRHLESVLEGTRSANAINGDGLLEAPDCARLRAKECRIMCLIDPPYEDFEQEAAEVLRCVERLLLFVPQACIQIWIPLFEPMRNASSLSLQKELAGLCKRQQCDCVSVSLVVKPTGMIGSTVIVINPPRAWQAQRCEYHIWLKEPLEFVCRAMEESPGMGHVDVQWHSPDDTTDT